MLLFLRTEYHSVNILIALSLNRIIVYLVVRLKAFFEKSTSTGRTLHCPEILRYYSAGNSHQALPFEYRY